SQSVHSSASHCFHRFRPHACFADRIWGGARLFGSSSSARWPTDCGALSSSREYAIRRGSRARLSFAGELCPGDPFSLLLEALRPLKAGRETPRSSAPWPRRGTGSSSPVEEPKASWRRRSRGRGVEAG